MRTLIGPTASTPRRSPVMPHVGTRRTTLLTPTGSRGEVAHHAPTRAHVALPAPWCTGTGDLGPPPGRPARTRVGVPTPARVHLLGGRTTPGTRPPRHGPELVGPRPCRTMTGLPAARRVEIPASTPPTHQHHPTSQHHPNSQSQPPTAQHTHQHHPTCQSRPTSQHHPTTERQPPTAQHTVAGSPPGNLLTLRAAATGISR